LSHEIKILIIDDHPAMALGIQYLLEQDKRIKVLGIAVSGKEGIEMAERLLPTVVVLDLNLPDDTGIHIAAVIKEQNPSIHVIIHTGYEYAPYFNRLIESGVSGILNKSASPQDILEMIHMVIRGHTILPLSIFRQVQLQLPDNIKHYWEADLTETELKILSMVTSKFTNSKIASIIHVSESSVENYLKKIYGKLGVKSKAEALVKITNDDRFQSILDIKTTE
jgi:two-component system competent response regulator ComA